MGSDAQEARRMVGTEASELPNRLSGCRSPAGQSEASVTRY